MLTNCKKTEEARTPYFIIDIDFSNTKFGHKIQTRIQTQKRPAGPPRRALPFSIQLPLRRGIPSARNGSYFFISPCATDALRIFTGSLGTSENIPAFPVGTLRILSTTSIPSITFPKTA